MWVHLRLQRNMLQLSHPSALHRLLFLLAPDLPDPPAQKKPDGSNDNNPFQNDEPQLGPQRRCNNEWKEVNLAGVPEPVDRLYLQFVLARRKRRIGQVIITRLFPAAV